eukprot:COSAG02_NODE_74711_length_154_cov_944.836364_1_plen_37_part_10
MRTVRGGETGSVPFQAPGTFYTVVLAPRAHRTQGTLR